MAGLGPREDGALPAEAWRCFARATRLHWPWSAKPRPAELLQTLSALPVRVTGIVIADERPAADPLALAQLLLGLPCSSGLAELQLLQHITPEAADALLAGLPSLQSFKAVVDGGYGGHNGGGGGGSGAPSGAQSSRAWQPAADLSHMGGCLNLSLVSRGGSGRQLLDLAGGISSATGLTALRIQGNILAQSFPAISSLRHLQELQLRGFVADFPGPGWGWPPLDLSPLAALSRLQALDLQYPVDAVQHWPLLAGLPQLQQLSVEWLRLQQGMPPASKVTALTLYCAELFSVQELLARWHVGSLSSLLPSLQRLDATVYWTEQMELLLEALQGHPTLQHLCLKLDLEAEPIPVEWGPGLLARLPALQRLGLQSESTACASLLDELAQCSGLEQLDLQMYVNPGLDDDDEYVQGRSVLERLGAGLGSSLRSLKLLDEWRADKHDVALLLKGGLRQVEVAQMELPGHISRGDVERELPIVLRWEGAAPCTVVSCSEPSGGCAAVELRVQQLAA